MTWIKGSWRWLAVNTAGLIIFIALLWGLLAEGVFDVNHDLTLMNSGKWAIRFLLISLSMTPLNTLFGWRNALKVRKPAGLWAFGFAALHFAAFVTADVAIFLKYPVPDDYAALGAIGLGVLSLMAATSTDWAKRVMRKWWKRLHRLVYAASAILMLHALLEAPNKRIAMNDSQASVEVAVYAAILAILLLARIPTIRSLLSGLRYRQRASTGFTP